VNRKSFLLVLLVALLWAANAFGWSFAVAGDSRDDKDGIFPQILSAVDDSDMEFLLHTGDMVNQDSPGEWDLYREATARSRKPVRVVIGNHEIYGGGTPEKFAERFGLPGSSWSFTHKDAHFAIVDNAKGTFTDNTLAWLDRDLAAHKKGKNGITTLVVAMHFPPATNGIHPHGTRSDYEEKSATLLAILKRHGADAVLSGHEHMHYVEDWEGVMVLISGGAGAPLAPFQTYGYYRIDVGNGRVRETFKPVRPEKRSRAGAGHSFPGGDIPGSDPG
jgi:3',5'-cyclic AMP phosphodiesterase CpdA